MEPGLYNMWPFAWIQPPKDPYEHPKHRACIVLDFYIHIAILGISGNFIETWISMLNCIKSVCFQSWVCYKYEYPYSKMYKICVSCWKKWYPMQPALKCWFSNLSLGLVSFIHGFWWHPTIFSSTYDKTEHK